MPTSKTAEIAKPTISPLAKFGKARISFSTVVDAATSAGTLAEGRASRSSAIAAYWDVLNTHAFGNYRDLLEAITLNPAIQLRLENRIGSIDVDGLEERNGRWVNASQLNSPVTIRVEVKGGVGEIKLIAE